MEEKEILLYQSARNGDRDAREAILLRHMGLVGALAGRYVCRGMDREDLMEEGTLGLLFAIRHFDPERGNAFSTFAVPHILGRLRRWAQKEGSISLCRRQAELYERLLAFRENRAAEGRTVHLYEAARAVGAEPEEAVFLLSAAPVPHDAAEAPDPQRAEDTAVLRADLDVAMKGFDEREKAIIFYRYYKDESQRECARRFGMSQAQISRLEKNLLLRLRKYLQNSQ